MKRLILALAIVTVVFAGCSADSLTGPAGDDRGLEPTNGECSINTRLC